jgi:chemotaxis protein CheD
MTEMLQAVAQDVRRIVGISEIYVSSRQNESIATLALGSCLGVVIFDPVTKVGGMLHALLPDSQVSPERAQQNPDTFVDTGVPRLFRAAYALGAVKQRLLVTVAGGAAMRVAGTEENEDVFQIGRRNFVALRRILWRNSVMIHSHDVGGNASRTMELRLRDGRVRLTSQGKEIPLATGGGPCP